MKNKRVCIPGIICFKNMTIMCIIIACFVAVFYLIYTSMYNPSSSSYPNNSSSNPYISNENSDKVVINNNVNGGSGFPNILDYRDILLNPYAAPYYDQQYLSPTASNLFYGTAGGYTGLGLGVGMGNGYYGPGGIGTSGNVSNFRQVGILTPKHGDPDGKIMPLMGRPISTSRGTWNYYTVSNQHNNMKIPVRVNGGYRKGGREGFGAAVGAANCKTECNKKVGKSGLAEYGVNEVLDGDDVFLEGYNKDYNVTLYDNANMV